MIKQNPWWEREDWSNDDPHLQKYVQMGYRWTPKWLKDLSRQPFSLNFVLGPRQIGKTTGIKLLIRELLKEASPKSVLYLNGDLLVDAINLRKVLEKYNEIKKEEKIKTSFIFLDEASSIEGWWKTIKGFIDLGSFNNDIITVSGSLSVKLKKEAELFPGRRGQGKDIFVHPLSFREFVEIHRTDNQELNKTFEKYLQTGGFPLSINEDPRAEEYFISAFESDLAKLGKSIRTAKEILASIMVKVPSPLSYHTIAKTIGISHKTVQDYIEVFENMFILKLAYFHDGKRINFRKEKKIVFLDTFIARALSEWSMEKFLESALYEWVIQSHLVRKYGDIFYFRNNYEIDCLFKDLKIEVKTAKPHRKYPPGVIVLDKEDMPGFLMKKV